MYLHNTGWFALSIEIPLIVRGKYTLANETIVNALK